MNDQKQLLSISKKAFLNVIYILLILILSAGVLTLFIQPGSFLRDSDGMVISGVSHLLKMSITQYGVG